jgi:hypothetical protein
MPSCERDADYFARDYDGVRRLAARTDPRLFRCRAVRRPFFYQDIRLPVTTDAACSDGLRISDVHARSVLFPLGSHQRCKTRNA